MCTFAQLHVWMSFGACLWKYLHVLLYEMFQCFVNLSTTLLKILIFLFLGESSKHLLNLEKQILV